MTALTDTVSRISGVEPELCYQCGTCSAGCPIVERMDVGPRRVLLMLQQGDESVLETETIWLCAACYTCDSRCPRGIRISALMEALRQMTLRKNTDHIRPEELPPETHTDLPPITVVAAMRKYTG